jgi:hypothetical protein
MEDVWIHHLSLFVMLPYFELGLVMPFLFLKVSLLLSNYFEILACDYSKLP